MWLKRELIEQAFTEIGLDPRRFNVEPDDLQSALRSLDAMMATWNAKGLRLGYALPATPSDSDIDADSGLPDLAYEAVCLALAIRIAPSFGKQVSPDTRVSAKQAYDAVALSVAFPPEQPLKVLPKGAGNKPWRYGNSNPFFPEPQETLDAGNDAQIDPLNI